MSGLTAVSLFAGIEGIGLALSRAGVTVSAAVEIDPACRGVIARHFPDTVLFGDITEVTGDQLLAAGFVPERGILAGGSPCQDFSVSGRRAGLGGARSGLFWQLMRLADELRPRWLLFENVDGLLSSVCSCPGDETCTGNARSVRCGKWDKRNGKRVFTPNVTHVPDGGACPGGCMGLHGGAMGTVLGAVGKRWDGVAYRVLDAQHFGVPQRRNRVFIVGCAGDRAAPAEVLLEPEGMPGSAPAGGEARPGAAGGAAGRAGAGGGSGAVADPLTTRPYADRPAAERQLVTVSTLQGGGRRGHRVDAEGAAGGHLIPVQASHWGGNGSGVGKPGDPAFTLDKDGSPSGVAIIPPAGQSGPFASRAVSCALTARDAKGPDSDMTSGYVAYALRADPGAGNAHNVTYVAAPLTAGGAATPGVNPAGRRQEDDVNLVTQPMAFNPWTGGDMRIGYSEVASALNCGQVTGVITDPEPECVTGSVTHALTSEGADASEDGTGRGSPLVTVPGAGPALPPDVPPTVVRRLSPLERERLQGFPDEWTRWRLEGGELVEQSDAARDRQTGNAVAVPVVEWIARRLVAADAAAHGAEAGAA